MKKIIISLIFACSAFAITKANAAAITYQITATYSGDWVWSTFDDSHESLPTSDTVFMGNPTITMNFSYDSDALFLGYSGPPPNPTSVALYSGMTNISGTVAGYTFTADTGKVGVSNSNIDANTIDYIFLAVDTNDNLKGFSLANHWLVAASFGSAGDAEYLSSDTPPPTLTVGSLGAAVDLVFFDIDTANLHSVRFDLSSITPVSEVPLPAALPFMASSLLAMFGLARRRKPA